MKMPLSLNLIYWATYWVSDTDTRKVMNIHRKYSGEDLERKLLDIEFPDDDNPDKRHKNADLDLKYGKITELQYKKLQAEINQEPWVGIVSESYDPRAGVNGFFFELDWNEEFILMLRSNGYTGVTPDQVIDEWFNDLCKAILYEQGLADPNGIGGPLSSTTKITTKDGKTEYS